MALFRGKPIACILLLLTLLVTMALHLWRLEDFPPAISGDEADNGLEVLLLMADPQLIAFAPSNAGREAMFHYMLMLPIAIFGPTAFALRLIPTLAGILIVPLAYRWVRELLPPSPIRTWIALLTAIFAATSPWLLPISRLGLRGVLLIPAMLAAYLFFWRGYVRQQYRWFVWSGIFLGLAVNTYTASRSLPLAFIAFAVVSLFYRRVNGGQPSPPGPLSQFLGEGESRSDGGEGQGGRRDILTPLLGLLITGLTSLLVFAPLGWYFLNNPGAFIYRSGQVSLWAIYQSLHAHTGQSFSRFLLQTWVDNLIWFGQISAPWRDGGPLPPWISGVSIFCAVGVVIALFRARRQPGYAFLLITFGLGILPIFIGRPTTMRVILAAPATYALLALGLVVPLQWVTRRLTATGGLALTASLATAALVIGLVSSIALFQPQRWFGLPPLPTEWDYIIDAATERVRAAVIDEGQSVLVPQAVINFPTAQFLLQADFASPLPVADPARLAQGEHIVIFWPLEWERWFENKLPAFTLLTPGVEGQVGYVETAGQWEPSQVDALKGLVQTAQASGAATTVVDGTGRPIAQLVEADRAVVLDVLRTEPQYPLPLSFGDEIRLLGYDAAFVDGQTLDVGLFWQAQRNILADHSLLLQLIDRQGQVVAETFSQFDAPTAGWFPGQLIIDHQLLRPTAELTPDIYLLKAGLVKINYKEPIRSEYGEWVTDISRNGQSLAGPLIPLGQLPIGDVPPVEHELVVNFGDQIHLTGYRLSRNLSTGRFQILLRWQASQPLSQDYTVTIQLLDAQEAIVAQIDRPPFGGAYPTSTWPGDTPIIDIYDLDLPPSVTAGSYRLAVGLYDFETLERLPINTEETPAFTNLAVMQQVNLN